MDIIITLNFYNYLNDIDYLNLLITNKQYYYLLNEDIYKNIIQKKFSIEFIDKVRNLIYSWKDCYIRIRRFEQLMLKYNNDLWYEQQYFNYWEVLNNLYKNSSRDEIYRNYYRNYYKNNYNNEKSSS